MELNYNIDISKYKVIKDKDEQFNMLFYSGHPLFLIPDFSEYPEDIHLGILDYLEKINQKPVYDQDGGEVESHTIIEDSGLTKCNYIAYGISFDKDEEPKDYKLEIFGYVVKASYGEGEFIATKVIIN